MFEHDHTSDDRDKKHVKIKERSSQQLHSLEKRNKGRNLRKQKKEARKIIEKFILWFYQRFSKCR